MQREGGCITNKAQYLESRYLYDCEVPLHQDFGIGFRKWGIPFSSMY